MSDKTNKLDTSLIRELAEIIKDGDLGEIEVEHGDLRIRVSRPEPVPVSIAAPIAPQMQPAAAPVQAASVATASASEQPESNSSNLTGAITSPMVGTAYLSPEPGAARFIKEGDSVSEGQTLLLVEAMKTFNPVTASTAGVVKKILIEDGQPVEYGEPLVVLG